MYLHTSAYSLHKNVPFSVYGENVVIGFQNFIIIIMFWKYNHDVLRKEKIFCTLFFIAYSAVLLSDKIISDNMWQLIVYSNIICSKDFI